MGTRELTWSSQAFFSFSWASLRFFSSCSFSTAARALAWAWQEPRQDNTEGLPVSHKKPSGRPRTLGVCFVNVLLWVMEEAPGGSCGPFCGSSLCGTDSLLQLLSSFCGAPPPQWTLGCQSRHCRTAKQKSEGFKMQARDWWEPRKGLDTGRAYLLSSEPRLNLLPLVEVLQADLPQPRQVLLRMNGLTLHDVFWTRMQKVIQKGIKTT